MIRKTLLGFAALLLFLVLCSGSAFATTYTMQNLGIMHTTGRHEAGLNEWGTVVGTASNTVKLWPAGAGAKFDVCTGTAADINDHGHIVLKSGSDNYLRIGSGMTPLGSLGAISTTVVDLNNSDQVVGYDTQVDGTQRALLWQSGSVSILNGLGGIHAQAAAINNSGLIVGHSTQADGRDKAVTWIGSTPSTFAATNSWYSTQATAVNDAGWVVGYGVFTPNSSTDTNNHALLWKDGSVYRLDDTGDSTYATGINNNGQVVGQKNFAGNSDAAAWVWSEGTGRQWLNQLVPTRGAFRFTYCYGINDKGQILCEGMQGDSYFRTILLTPVPEPSSLLALGSGLVALGGLIRRRR